MNLFGFKIPPTTILAIWGAILSTILGGIQVYSFYRDRKNVKVTVIGGYKIIPHAAPYGDKSLIVVKAVNKGRRAVYLTKAGLFTFKKSSLISGSIKTIKLDEGQYYDYLAFEEEYQAIGLTPKHYIAFVIDSTGKFYYSANPLKRLWYFKKIRY